MGTAITVPISANFKDAVEAALSQISSLPMTISGKMLYASPSAIIRHITTMHTNTIQP